MLLTRAWVVVVAIGDLSAVPEARRSSAGGGGVVAGSSLQLASRAAGDGAADGGGPFAPTSSHCKKENDETF